MKSQVGVWIDHTRAVIVDVTNAQDVTRVILSEVESQLQRAGDSPLKGKFEAQHVPADDSRQRAYTEHLNGYYDEVIAGLQGSDTFLILGPGEAKGELKKRLEKSSMGDRIAGVETADKLTEPQIAAKIRQHFAA